jgi:hypothetical protein
MGDCVRGWICWQGFDARAIARKAKVPVCYLAGLVGPLVRWAVARWWLRRKCSGYRGGKTC